MQDRFRGSRTNAVTVLSRATVGGPSRIPEDEETSSSGEEEEEEEDALEEEEEGGMWQEVADGDDKERPPPAPMGQRGNARVKGGEEEVASASAAVRRLWALGYHLPACREALALCLDSEAAALRYLYQGLVGGWWSLPGLCGWVVWLSC